MGSKVRGAGMHQENLLRAFIHPEQIKGLVIEKNGLISLVTHDGEMLLTGELHSNWYPLLIFDMLVTQWWITGGRPTGYVHHTFGELHQHFGLNFHAEIGVYDGHIPLSRNTAEVPDIVWEVG